MKSFIFDVAYAGEPAAGFYPYTEEVTISVASGDYGGLEVDFMYNMRDALAHWYIGAKVTAREEPNDKTL